MKLTVEELHSIYADWGRSEVGKPSSKRGKQSARIKGMEGNE